MYQNRIYGLKEAAKKMAARNRSNSPGGKGTDPPPPPPGPSRDGDTAAKEDGFTTGSPPLKSGADLGTEAVAK